MFRAQRDPLASVSRCFFSPEERASGGDVAAGSWGREGRIPNLAHCLLFRYALCLAWRMLGAWRGSWDSSRARVD